jgi:antirestriction protein ArdC
MTVKEIIVQRFLESLEKGTPPWKKSWKRGIPKNFVSKRKYQGINALLLAFAETEYPLFLTWNQIKQLEGRIKNDENGEMLRGHIVVLYKTVEKEVENSKTGNLKTETVAFYRYYRVWSIADLDGIEYEADGVDILLDPAQKIDRAEAILDKGKEFVRIAHNNTGTACYLPMEDRIEIPAIGHYETADAYYSTAFHELIHATGIPKRCNRYPLSEAPTEKYQYGIEELVAEIGACFLCAEAGIDVESLIPLSASYLDGWIKKINERPTIIFEAVRKAKEAVAYLLGCEQEEKGE